MADIQKLAAKALWAKKNVHREKPIKVQALAAMKKFKKIQISSAPKSDPLGHLPRRMDFLTAHVHNLGISLFGKFVDFMDTVLPRLIVDALEERLHELISDTLKNQFPQLAILKALIRKFIHKNVRVTMGDLIETSPPPVGAVAKGEKSDQAGALNPGPQKSPLYIFIDDQQDASLNATTTPTQGESQLSVTSNDPNALAMVVQSEAEPTEEPTVKKFIVIIDIPTPVPLNSIKPTIIDSIPFDQFSAQNFGVGLS
ncbi:hypothetical protein Tco_0400606 [Tanacetum coccineum]